MIGLLQVKWLRELNTALCADDGLLIFNEDSGDDTFCCIKMSILSVNLNNINLDNNFDENDPWYYYYYHSVGLA